MHSNENKQPSHLNASSLSSKLQSAKTQPSQQQTKSKIQVQSTFVKKNSPDKFPMRAPVSSSVPHRYEDEDDGDDGDDSGDDEIGWSPFVIPG